MKEFYFVYSKPKKKFLFVSSCVIFLLISCKTFSPNSSMDIHNANLSSEAQIQILLEQIKQATANYGNESNFQEWNQNVNLVLNINKKWTKDLEILVQSLNKSTTQLKFQELFPNFFAMAYRNQKLAVNDDQKWFADYWLKVQDAAANNRKMFADIQGIQIRNFTELLKAENQSIKNQTDRLKNIAYQLYLVGYQNQVQNYIAYSAVIRTAYAQKIRNTQNLARAITKMRDYQKASNSCLYRAKALTRKINTSAAEATLYRQTRWEKLSDKLRFYANKDYGSFCLSSLMLSMHRMNQSQFANSFRYIHYKNPGNLAVVCPAGTTDNLIKKFPAIQELNAEDKNWFSRDLDLAQYPNYFELSNDYTGVLIPVTPYQFYKLLTQNNPILETTLDPTDTRSAVVDQCDRTRNKIGMSPSKYNELFNNYVKLSRDFEDALFENMAQNEPKLTSNYLRFVKEASPIGAAKVPSKAHQEVLSGMHRIFNATDQCINFMQNQDNIALDPVNNTTTQTPTIVAPTANTPIATTNNNNLGFLEINAPFFPEESRALQTCMANAMDLKKQAQLDIEMSQAIQTLLDNEAKTAAPKGMLPMFGSDNNVIGPLPVGNF